MIYEFERTAFGNWRFLYVSEGINELFGITPEAALADHASLSECIVAEDRASHKESVEQSARALTPWTHEHRIRTRSGELKWVRGQAVPQGRGDGSVLWRGILINITRLKQTEQALLESEQRWMFALEGAGDGVWDWNLRSGQAHFSRRWKLMLGYDDAEIGNEATEWSSRVHPEDMPAVMDALQAHLDGKTASVVVEFRIRRKAGDWCWTQGRGMLVSRDATGQTHRPTGCPDVPRPGQLQVAERQSRACRGRPASGRGRPPAEELCARDRYRGALWRRRVRRPAEVNDRS